MNNIDICHLIPVFYTDTSLLKKLNFPRHIAHQSRIFEVEIELYKAKDYIAVLEARIAAKNKIIAQLKSSNNHYKREKEKRLREESEKASNYSKLSVC